MTEGERAVPAILTMAYHIVYWLAGECELHGAAEAVPIVVLL